MKLRLNALSASRIAVSADDPRKRENGVEKKWTRRMSSLFVLPLLLSMIVTIALPVESAQAAVDNPGTGLSTNFDWAGLVLEDGGWPNTSNNITVITQWMTSEEPTSDWWDRNNPLNNGLGSGGGSGLGSYNDLSTAAYYVALNLESNSYGYPAVAADLAASAAPASRPRQSGTRTGHQATMGMGRRGIPAQ